MIGFFVMNALLSSPEWRLSARIVKLNINREDVESSYLREPTVMF